MRYLVTIEFKDEDDGEIDYEVSEFEIKNNMLMMRDKYMSLHSTIFNMANAKRVTIDVLSGDDNV